MKSNVFCVIKTSNPPTAAIEAWEQRFGRHLIVVSGSSAPADWACGKADYYSIERQAKLPLESLAYIPEGHCARKNIGYLRAMVSAASSIFETDDDCAPMVRWNERPQRCEHVYRIGELGWCNVYANLMGPGWWPRGLPLNSILQAPLRTEAMLANLDAPIQQGLTEGEPDVDAIWKLATVRYPAISVHQRSIALRENVWCPFSSQSTWWFPDAYELMYLPIGANYRMSDIWRSFIAQRCLWAMGKSVVYHVPEVSKFCSTSEPMADFEAEIPGYLRNEALVELLGKLPLTLAENATAKNMRACYTALADGGFLPKEELASVDAWLSDVRRAKRS